MIKQLILTTLLLTSSAHAVTLFGHSSSKVNKLRSTLEQIKADYDKAVARASELQLQLDKALESIKTANQEKQSHMADMGRMRQDLKRYDDQCTILRHELEVTQRASTDHESLIALIKEQVDRLTAATTKLEDLEKDVNAMMELPESIFGNLTQ